MSSDVNVKSLAKCVIKGGKIGHYWLESVNEALIETSDAYLEIKTKGDLSSFQWFEAPHKLWDSLSLKERDEKLSKLYVFYSSLNFKDVMVATGRIPLNAYPNRGSLGNLGMEFSGIDENGNRICGLSMNYSITTTKVVNDNESITFPVPSHWTLEEAATVPLVYFTVYYSLIIRGKLLPKEKVLIHAGSGGVGQAAIAVCLSMGCEVFTSVGTEEKKQFLKNRFPQLEERHFVNSRDLTFEEHILKETNGRGVDMVLNSLAEEKLRASINCLEDFGRFIEIGKVDIIQNNPFDSTRFERNISFHVVCVAHLFRQFADGATGQAKSYFHKLISIMRNDLRDGKIKPLSRTVFSIEEAENAFRFMASGKHVGKVLIRIRDEEESMKYLKPLKVTAVARTYFYTSKVYLLVGGLGGIGLELGQWLVERGAKKLIFTSRTGIKNNYQKYRIQEMEKQGASVRVICNDASTRELTQELIKEATKMGEIGGIFNLAMILRDALFKDQTEETFRAACVPKVNTTLFLDEVTREHCLQLDFFVCFSSAASGMGNSSQSNYGFANSVMESICEKRRADNLHGLAIQWGPVGDVGFVLETLKTNNVVLLGLHLQRIPSCLKAIDTFMNSGHSICASFVQIENYGSNRGSRGDLLRKITYILGVKDPSSLDDNTTLGDLGLDSLIAIEIKQGLEREYNTVMSTKEIRLLTIKQIKELSQKTSEALESRFKKEVDYDSHFENQKEVFVRLDKINQGIPIFFIPPIEGNFKLMKPLVEYITRPVIGINWTDETDSLLSITKVASFYVKKLKESYPQPEYEFIAYSFGSLIAFEMCVQLQDVDSNSVKKLFILDGDLDFMKNWAIDLHQNYSVSNETEAFHKMLIEFVALMHPLEIVENFQKEILAFSTKDEQIKKAVEIINHFGIEVCTEESLNSAVQRLYDKLKRIESYKPTKQFKGNVKLICSTRDNQIDTKSTRFRQLIDGTLDKETMIGDHKSFLTNNYKDIGSFIEDHLNYLPS